MGFRIADAVTGRAMEEGTPVVAFLVNRNTQYPYGDNPNQAPLSPCDIFVFESLPIYGTYDGYGGVEPANKDSAAVTVAIAQGGGGTTVQKLMAPGVGDSFQLLGASGEENKRAYGAFIVQQETFERVCALITAHSGKTASMAEQRDTDVGLILHIVNRYLALSAKGRGSLTEGENQQLYEGMQLCGLRTSVGTGDDGEDIEMPQLARALESRDMLGEDIQRTLRALLLLSNIPLREPCPRSTVEIPYYTEFLEALWMSQQFYQGLDLLDVTVVPSKRTRIDSAAAKLHMAAVDVESLVRERLTWATEGYGDIEDIPALEADVRVVTNVAGRLEAELRSVRTKLTRDYVERARRT